MSDAGSGVLFLVLTTLAVHGARAVDLALVSAREAPIHDRNTMISSLQGPDQRRC